MIVAFFVFNQLLVQFCQSAGISKKAFFVFYSSPLCKAVYEPFNTGFRLIDSGIPIGHDNGDFPGTATHFHYALTVFTPALRCQNTFFACEHAGKMILSSTGVRLSVSATP